MNRGFTLLELLLGIAVSTLMVLASVSSVKSATHATAGAIDRDEHTVGLLQATHKIQKVGRTALACHKEGAETLKCQLPDNSWAQFHVKDGALIYEKGPEENGPWAKFQQTDGVAKFIICDENDMDPAVEACELPNYELGKRRAQMRPAPRILPLKFFMYKLVALTDQNYVRKHSHFDLPSVFFTRNGDELVYVP